MRMTIRALALLACTFAPGLAPAAEPASLQDTIADLDTQVFGAFNQCQDPARLAEHAAFFDPKVEFYHDTGGVTWTREQMLDNTRKYACGHFTRQLVPGSLKVYPIKDFGAIEQGQHRFCHAGEQRCEGLADFTIVWHRQDGQWTITRVLSYGHRSD